jgi:hypothetical protein
LSLDSTGFCNILADDYDERRDVVRVIRIGQYLSDSEINLGKARVTVVIAAGLVNGRNCLYKYKNDNRQRNGENSDLTLFRSVWMSRVALLTEPYPVFHSVIEFLLVQITDDDGKICCAKVMEIAQ